MVNFNLIKLFPSAETGRIFVPFSTSNLSRTKLTVFSKYFTGAVILTNDFNSDSMLPRARQNVAEIFVPFRAPSPPFSSTNRHFSTSMPHHGCSSRPRNAFPRCVCVWITFLVFSSCSRNGCGYDNDCTVAPPLLFKRFPPRCTTTSSNCYFIR